MRKYTILTVALSVILATALSASAQSRVTQNREANREFNFGMEMANNNMATSAIPFFRSVLESYPTSDRVPEARFYLAQSLDKIGDTGAIAVYQDFLRLHPTSSLVPAARYGLAFALFNAGQWGASVSAFDEFATRHASDSAVPRARYFQGLALVRLNRPLDALIQFKAAADSANSPQSAAAAGVKAEYAFQQAAALHLAGRSDEAAEALTIVSRLYPGTEAQGKADQLIGDILFRRGRYAEARRSYTAALNGGLKASGVADEATYWRAWAGIRAGDTRTGVFELMALADSYPESRRAVVGLKQAAEQSELLPDAALSARALARLVELATAPADLAYAQYQRGRLAFAAGDTEAARTAMLAVLPLNAGFTMEAQYVLGLLAITSHDYATSESFLKQAEVQAVADPESLEKIQTARLEAMRLSGNMAAYQELAAQLEARRSPALAHVLFNGAQLRQQQSDLEGAVRDYTRIADKFPLAPEAGPSRFRLGVIRYEQARYSEAETTLQRYLTGPPAPDAGLADDAWYWIGFARFQAQRTTEALTAFREASRIPDADKAALAIFRAGNAAYNLHSYPEAATLFEQAAAHPQATPELKLDAGFNLGEALRAQGYAERARSEYLKVYQQGGLDYEQALLNACAALEDLDLRESAAIAYADAAPRFTALGRQEEAWLKAGENRLKNAQPRDAIELFARAAALNGPLAADALMRSGEAYLAIGDTTKAAETFRLASELYPASHFGRRATLRLALLAPEAETTAILLAGIIASAPDDPAAAEAELRLGRMAQRAGALDSAVALLKLALQNLPDDEHVAEARVALAEIHLERRQWSNARTMSELIYRSAMYRQSAFRGRAGLLLGKALVGLGQRVDALKVLREVVDGYPDVAAEARSVLASSSLESVPNR